MTRRQTTKKHISIPTQLLELAEGKANRFGFNLAEYVRFLIAKDVEDYEIPMVSEIEEKEIGKALDDIKKGKFVRVKNRKELEEYLLS